jgi:acyl-coenzyme A thioesterase PaaI-like protein
MNTQIQTYLVGDSYPPKDHILRDLFLEIEIHTTSQASIKAPVTSHVCSQNGVVYSGVLATLVDVVVGILAVKAISPVR